MKYLVHVNDEKDISWGHSQSSFAPKKVVRLFFALALTLFFWTLSTIIPLQSIGAAPQKFSQFPNVSSLQMAIQRSISGAKLPSNLMSQLSGEANSMFYGNGSNCPWGQPGSSSSAIPCVLGDSQSATTVVVYGDSFSLEWAPAFNAIGTMHHFKVELFSRLGCPFADLRTVDWKGTVDPGCLPFRQNVIDAINSMSPAPNLVVLSEESELQVPTNAWTEGIKRTISQLSQSNFPVDVMIGEATASAPPSTCLSRFALSISKCNSTSSAAIGHQKYSQIASAVLCLHAGVINTSSLFCFNGTCPDVISDTLVHSDSWHVDQAFATLVASPLSTLIACTQFQLPSLTTFNLEFLRGLFIGTPPNNLKEGCQALNSANGF